MAFSYLGLAELVMPYFVAQGRNKKQRIASFPNTYRFSIDNLLKEIAEGRALGIKSVLLFGITAEKDALASSAFNPRGIVQEAVRSIKKHIKDITVITDVCLCAYTEHGHCGIIKSQKSPLGFVRGRKVKSQNEVIIDNDTTVKTLSEVALSHAQAGADWVAPSAMADKQVKLIREKLDKNGFKHTKILAYSAKFASHFYGPFRNALDSAPRFGDRKGYQLDFSSSTRAIRQIREDIREGADMVMVKPALLYLDIIKEAKERFNLPLAAYNTSGEYAMLNYAARRGVFDYKDAVVELLTAIKRAGADLIITYHAKEAAGWLKG